MYNMAMDAHITMSAIDNNGKSVWINRIETRPLLVKDLYLDENTLDKVFTTLLNSGANLNFVMGSQICLNFYMIPELIHLQYPQYFGRK